MTALRPGCLDPFEVRAAQYLSPDTFDVLILRGDAPELCAAELFPSPELIQQLLACGVQIQDGTS
ncbi:hypothetical protein [Deinococcus kurensis]|uniref:hypothetical protein n=1 Tax=Deinococcus kurensis TaxID=2662757 RepID=UPI0012D3630C|nr:hypothetical protein [Deinococcus kurensis]